MAVQTAVITANPTAKKNNVIGNGKDRDCAPEIDCAVTSALSHSDCACCDVVCASFFT